MPDDNGRPRLDPNLAGPTELHATFKKYQRLKGESLEEDLGIVDFANGPLEERRFRKSARLDPEVLRRVFGDIASKNSEVETPHHEGRMSLYESIDVPGNDESCIETFLSFSSCFFLLMSEFPESFS